MSVHHFERQKNYPKIVLTVGIFDPLPFSFHLYLYLLLTTLSLQEGNFSVMCVCLFRLVHFGTPPLASDLLAK